MPHPAPDLLARSWQRCANALAPQAIAGSVFDELVARYSEPHRKYHTLQHLAECLAHFEAVRHLAEHPGEIEIALWFHDGIATTMKGKAPTGRAKCWKARARRRPPYSGWTS
jgi:predicted metal-dependent HD superfamily phosphohydrolase